MRTAVFFFFLATIFPRIKNAADAASFCEMPDAAARPCHRRQTSAQSTKEAGRVGRLGAAQQLGNKRNLSYLVFFFSSISAICNVSAILRGFLVFCLPARAGPCCCSERQAAAAAGGEESGRERGEREAESNIIGQTETKHLIQKPVR